MSVDIAGLRTRLADAIASAVGPSVPVHPSALDGVAVLPAVVLGMPSWRPGPTGCLSAYEFPVAVVVSRPGTSEAGTVDELDRVWPTVLDGLQVLVDRQQIDDVTRAEFGLFQIQGQPYPAQILHVSLTD